MERRTFARAAVPVLLALLFLSTAASVVAAPDLAWSDLSGHTQELSGLRGRIVVLNFWATWCKPCIDELPDLVRIQNRYGMYGVQVLGVSADPVDERARVAEFARKMNVNFPVVLGSLVGDMQALDVGVVLPATVVVDRDGQVVERIVGVFDRAELEATLDDVIAGHDRDDDRDDDHADEAGAAHDHAAAGDDHDHGHRHGKGTQASLVPS